MANLSSISFPSHPLPLRLPHRAGGAATRSDERVKHVRSVEALRTAKDKLVVVECAANHSRHSRRRIYPFMVKLSRACADVDLYTEDASSGGAT